MAKEITLAEMIEIKLTKQNYSANMEECKVLTQMGLSPLETKEIRLISPEISLAETNERNTSLCQI